MLVPVLVNNMLRWSHLLVSVICRFPCVWQAGPAVCGLCPWRHSKTYPGLCSSKPAKLLMQVASDMATIRQALLSCKILNTCLQSPTCSSSEGALLALLTALQTQELPNQAKSTSQQQPDQDHSLWSQPTSKSIQTQKSSLVQAQTGAHHSEIDLHSAVELQSCASELLYAIDSLSTTLSQHQPTEDACAGSLHMEVMQALSDQVRLSSWLKDFDCLVVNDAEYCSV